MKKHFFIVMSLMTEPLLAATTGFGGCEMCTQYISCVSQKVLDDVSKMDCSKVVLIDEETYDITNAVSACISSYTDMNQAKDVFGRLGANAALDYQKAFCNGVTMSDNDSMNIAYALVSWCNNYGFCYCAQGSYIQPRGLEPGKWGINSECLQCPDGGRTDIYNSFLLDSCYKQQGDTFSDETGSGEFTGKCTAQYSDNEEAENAWR